MRLGLAAVVAVAVGLLAWWLAPGHAPVREVQRGAEDARASSRAPAIPRVAPSAEVPMPDLPESLDGTVVDGALVVDADGRFRPTPDAIDFFDYYLSAVGEEPTARIRARIVAAIRARLDGENAAAAERLLDDYLEYRERAAELLTGELLGEDLDRRLQYVRELRRDAFGPAVADALFGDEEAQWFVDLERRRIASDPTLAPEERDAELAALDGELPDAVREARDAARAHRLLRDAEDELLAEGAGFPEIDDLREQRFGAEAAGRLAALDAERADWQERLDRYRAERDRLLADAPSEQRAALVEELRAHHFEGGELVRVRALDRAQARAVER